MSVSTSTCALDWSIGTTIIITGATFVLFTPEKEMDYFLLVWIIVEGVRSLARDLTYNALVFAKCIDPNKPWWSYFRIFTAVFHVLWWSVGWVVYTHNPSAVLSYIVLFILIVHVVMYVARFCILPLFLMDDDLVVRSTADALHATRVAPAPTRSKDPGDLTTSEICLYQDLQCTISISDEEEDLCPICKAPFQSADIVRVLLCKHYFHQVDCIDVWIKGHSADCPLCRRDII